MCIIVQWYAMYVYFVYTGWSMKSSNNWQSKICCPDLCGTWRPTNLDTEGTLAAGTHAKESKEKQTGRKVWQDVVQSLSLEYSHVLMLPGSQPTALQLQAALCDPCHCQRACHFGGAFKKCAKIISLASIASRSTAVACYWGWHCYIHDAHGASQCAGKSWSTSCNRRINLWRRLATEPSPLNPSGPRCQDEH